MKRFTTTLRFTLLFILLSSSFSAKAINYVTMKPGAWEDAIDVWSTDGGVTPCGCTPGATSAGNNITINHPVSVSTNLTFNGGSIIISNAGGTLTGTIVLTTQDVTATFSADVTISKWVQYSNTNVTFNSGSILSLTNRFDQTDGVFTLDGALVYMSTGNFDIANTADFNATNSSRVNIEAGNITNNGDVFVDGTSCMTSNGNWKNNASGTITGTGALTTVIGNMQNNGTWDVALQWCSAGSDFGMPSPEDCAGALGTCSAIVLPVEVASFDAVVYDNRYSEIAWTTIRENNNSHFVLMASRDLENWEEVFTIEGAGNSTEERNYSVENHLIEVGTTYYKLYQYDFDGEVNKLDPIAVIKISDSEDLIAYPNPIKNGTTLKIINSFDSESTAKLYDLNGNQILITNINAFNNSFEMALTDITPGVYFLKIEQNGLERSTRVMVTE